MVVSAGSLAVYNWHVTDPECNAQLSIVSARAVRHDRPSASASSSASCVVQQVQERTATRQRSSHDLLERFRRTTRRRLSQQKAKAAIESAQRESVLRANLAQYRATTETQIGRRLDQHASQLRSTSKAPLYRERDRVLAQARSVRQHLLSFRAKAPQAPDASQPAMQEAKPLPRARTATTPSATEPFWSRLPLHLQGAAADGAAAGPAIQLSRAQQAQLAAAIRKWEMEQDRYRARVEAQLARRARASSASLPSRITTPPPPPSASGRLAAAATDNDNDDDALDEGVQRLTLSQIPSESAVRRARSRTYGEAVRTKHRSVLAATARADRQQLRARRKQALQRVALAQIPVPALCACGLTIFADRAQTASCTARCLFYRDPEAFDSAVDNFLYSLEQCL